MDPFSIIWLFVILSVLQPAVQRQILAASRRLTQIAERRNATVITLIPGRPRGRARRRRPRWGSGFSLTSSLG